MVLTLKQKERFYRNRRKVDRVIVKNLKKNKHVVFGARATNALFPQFLDAPTEDYDVFSKTPKKTAKRVEKRLDKSFGGNFFEVKDTIFPGGKKVVSKVTGRNVADYVPPPKRKLNVFKRKGIRYTKLDTAKKNIKLSLSDPESKFRRARDIALRDRIKIFEKLRKTKKVKKVKKRRTVSSKKRFAPRSFRPNPRVTF